MSRQTIEISVALEPDQDWPVADIFYAGVRWASATLEDAELKITVYGDARTGPRIPIDDAVASLEQARRQLQEILGQAPRSP